MFTDGWVPIAKISHFLGVDYKTAIAWMKENDVKVMQVPRGDKRTTLVWKPDFDRFVEQHTVKPEPKPEPKRRGRPPKFQIAK